MANKTSASVHNVKSGPQARDDAAQGSENRIVFIDVLANDGGGNGKSLWSLDQDHSAAQTAAGAKVGLAGGARIWFADGKVAFDPGSAFDHLAAGATAAETFRYAIRMGNGAVSYATVSVTVTGTNDGPVAVADAAAGTENETLVVDVLANDTDVDSGHAFTLTQVAAPAGKGVASIVGNALTFAPGADFDHLAKGATETVVVGYTMRDEHGVTSSSTVTLTITGTNDGPVAVADAAAIAEDGMLTLDVLANDTDVDDGHMLTLLSAAAPAGKGAVSVVEGKLVFAPEADFDHLPQGATEIVTLTYVIADEHGANSASTVIVTVTGTNDRPLIASMAADAGGALREAGDDADAGVPSAGGTLRASDMDDGATAVWSGDAAGAYGDFAIDPATGAWTYMLDDSARGAVDRLAAGETRSEAFVATVADDAGATATQLVTLTITGTNDAPLIVAVAGDAARVTENAPGGAGDFVHGRAGTVGFADVDASDVHAAAVTAMGDDYLGSFALGAVDQAGDTLGWTFDVADGVLGGLAEGQTLTQSYRVAVSDGQGGVAERIVSVVLAGANDAPVAVDDAASVREDGSVLIDVLANDTDVDAGATRSILDGSVSATNGTAAIEDGRIRFTPDADYHGPATVAYRVTDGSLSSPGAVAITVTAVNDAPVVAGPVEGAAVEDGASVTMDALARAADVDDARLVVVDVPTDLPAGVSYDAIAQTFTLNPAAYQSLAAGARQVVSVAYGVSDGGVTILATVRWTVTGVNDGPVAVADVGAADEDAVVTLLASTLLANDTDVDTGDTRAVSAVQAVSAKGAAVSIDAAGNIAYDPTGSATLRGLAPGAATTDSFTYTVTDAGGLSSAATVTITVKGILGAPVASPDSLTVAEDGTGSGEVVGNDVVTRDTGVSVTAVNGDAAGVGRAVAGSTGGTFTVAADGTYKFDAGSAFDRLGVGESAVSTATYTVTDLGGSDTETISVTVTGVNDAVVRGRTIGARFEDADGTRSGTTRVYFSDADVTDAHTASIRPTGEAYVGGATAMIGKDADGRSYVDIRYSWSIADIEALPIDRLEQDYEITVSDGHGGDLVFVRTAFLEDVEYYVGTAADEDLGWVLGDRNLLVGNGGSDRLIGGDLGDHLYGDAGPGLPADEDNGPLDPYAGNNGFDDVLDGREGADLLIGGGGADRLTGGEGADLFRFDLGDANGDVVTDFSRAEGDVLQFAGWGAGATFTQVDATTWKLANANGSITELITFANGAEITSADYSFLM